MENGDIRPPAPAGALGPSDIEPTQQERLEAGLQDTLTLTDWKMPSARDYSWYLLIYASTISLSVYVILRYRMLWAYVLWGGYLVALVIMASLIVRSLRYRRLTYSKSFYMATLDLQQAVEKAMDSLGIRIDTVERPPDVFLRPMIAEYRLIWLDFSVSIEGRSHMRRKVVRVGRFPDAGSLEMGKRFCQALDSAAADLSRDRTARRLFHEGPD